MNCFSVFTPNPARLRSGPYEIFGHPSWPKVASQRANAHVRGRRPSLCGRADVALDGSKISFRTRRRCAEKYKALPVSCPRHPFLFFRTNDAIKMVGAIRTDQPAGGFEGQPDLPAQNQVPVLIPEPYFLTAPIHDCLDRRSQQGLAFPAALSQFIVNVLAF